MKIFVDQMPESTAECPYHLNFIDQDGVTHGNSSVCGWRGCNGGTFTCPGTDRCPFFIAIGGGPNSRIGRFHFEGLK